MVQRSTRVWLPPTRGHSTKGNRQTRKPGIRDHMEIRQVPKGDKEVRRPRPNSRQGQRDSDT